MVQQYVFFISTALKMPLCTHDYHPCAVKDSCDYTKTASGEKAVGCCGNDCVNPGTSPNVCRANRGCFDVGLTDYNLCCPATNDKGEKIMLACCDTKVCSGNNDGDKCQITVDGELFSIGECVGGECQDLHSSA